VGRDSPIGGAKAKSVSLSRCLLAGTGDSARSDRSGVEQNPVRPEKGLAPKYPKRWPVRGKGGEKKERPSRKKVRQAQRGNHHLLGSTREGVVAKKEE